MVKYIIKILVVAASLLVAEHFVEGIVIDNFWPTAVLAAVVFGILGITVKPLLKLFSLPITVMTLGLFGFLINILVFWLIAFVPGITIGGFANAFWGLIIVTVAGWLVDMVFKDK
jgi:putative membrane protein